MTKTLLLHVGFPKTGTTTLQAGLFASVDTLYFMGKFVGQPHAPEIDDFRTLVNYGSAYHVRQNESAIREGLTRVWAQDGSDIALLSLEGLTNPFVDTDYAQPKDIYRKATDIGTILAPLRENGVDIRVLATIRRQTSLLPSLFSQIYLQGFASGLYPPSYDGFLDFFFEDDVMGFGPDFFYDAYLDSLGEIFGAEHVTVAEMGGMLSGTPCRDTQALAAFLGISEKQCITLIGTRKHNVRKTDTRRRMMTNSPAVDRFDRNTGVNIKRKAFGAAGWISIKRGKKVLWDVPDRTDRIAAYYAQSNDRLAERYGIRL